MTYQEFCAYLSRLESTAKRLEITSILSELIDALEAKEVEKGIFLSLGYLNPPYDPLRFNMAGKMVIRALELSCGVDQQKISRLYANTGDLGDVAESLCVKGGKSNLSILEVHKRLSEIAKDNGTGSQDRKVSKLADLLTGLSPLSAKYLIRIVLGITRLGFTEQTIIDALSKFLTDDKTCSRKIEEAYNIHPNVGYIASVLKEKGLKGLEGIKVETGVPVLSQKAQRLSDPEEILEKMAGRAWAEFKLDGTRVQLHLDRTKTGSIQQSDQSALFDFNKNEFLVKTFTRNLEENTYQFPDIVESALKQIDAESIILDGEAIGYDAKSDKYIPFQDMMQRKRKHNVGEYAKQIPLRYMVFDILYLDGKSLIGLSLEERHKLLEKSVHEDGIIRIAEHIETTQSASLWQYFETSKEKNLEGTMIKNPNVPYRAGAREFSWIKLKRSNTELLEDTVDCVVLGYYFGRGNRANFGIGGFLCGIWDEKGQAFTTLTKVGTGLTDEEWVELKRRCDKIKVKEPPKNVTVAKVLIPDVWTRPEIVVELGGDEISVSQVHTSGYALRFPRLMKFRDDREPHDTTTPKEIQDLHNLQRKNQRE